jgi:hypothetical protein
MMKMEIDAEKTAVNLRREGCWDPQQMKWSHSGSDLQLWFRPYYNLFFSLARNWVGLTIKQKQRRKV